MSDLEDLFMFRYCELKRVLEKLDTFDYFMKSSDWLLGEEAWHYMRLMGVTGVLQVLRRCCADLRLIQCRGWVDDVALLSALNGARSDWLGYAEELRAKNEEDGSQDFALVILTRCSAEVKRILDLYEKPCA